MNFMCFALINIDFLCTRYYFLTNMSTPDNYYLTKLIVLLVYSLNGFIHIHTNEQKGFGDTGQPKPVVSLLLQNEYLSTVFRNTNSQFLIFCVQAVCIKCINIGFMASGRNFNSLLFLRLVENSNN